MQVRNGPCSGTHMHLRITQPILTTTLFQVHSSSPPHRDTINLRRGRRKGGTYLLIVSLSPTMQRCLFGRVMATLSLLFSPKKPTSYSGLLRTVLTTTASFSRPWNPSTDPSSSCGYFSFNKPASSASYDVQRSVLKALKYAEIWQGSLHPQLASDRRCRTRSARLRSDLLQGMMFGDSTYLCIIRRNNRNVFLPDTRID